MNFAECKEKYFIIVEGEERAIIRGTEKDAERKQKKTCKVQQGKENFYLQGR